MSTSISNAKDLVSEDRRELGQSLQPSAVFSPCLGRTGRDASIVVEVYAIGSGIEVDGNLGNLSRAEGAFELEANRKLFGFNPLASRKAKWHVAPVKRNVTAIIQPLKAVRQGNGSEVGTELGHVAATVKTAILSLPQGWGKTTMGHELAKRLGCSAVVDEWAPSNGVVPGALHLTNFSLEATR